MLKKYTAILLALILALSLAGCGPAETPASSAPPVASLSESPAEPAADPLLELAVEKPASDFTGYRSVVYFTDWTVYGRKGAPSDVDPNLLTHINIAFAKPTPDGKVELFDPYADVEFDFADRTIGTKEENKKGVFGQLRALKETNPNLKLMISIGGWTLSKDFSDIAANPAIRDQFAKSCADFVVEHDLDGVDIDWEYPVEGGNTDVVHRPEDKQNFTLLMKSIRNELNLAGAETGKRYELSFAGYTGTNFVNTIEPAEVMQYVDFVNIMAYDYHGGWDSYTSFNAPMNANEADPTDMADQCITKSIDTYIAGGFPADSIVLGVPFYGRGWAIESSENNGLFQKGTLPSGTGEGKGTWEAGVFDCWEIEEKYLGEYGYTRYFDETAQVPYVSNGEVWISYEDAESIKIKADYVKEKGLGGMMAWEFYGDNNKALQTVIAQELSINQ